MFGRELFMACVFIGRNANDGDPRARQTVDVVPQVACLLRATRRGVLWIKVKSDLDPFVVGEVDHLAVKGRTCKWRRRRAGLKWFRFASHDHAPPR